MRGMLIVNPHATSTTARRRDLLSNALAGRVRLTVEHTAGRGHAMDLAAKAVDLGARLVVVHGGDGTVNEVVNGLLSRGRPAAELPMLAVVPGGSTNVFARAMGVEADPVAATEQILDALASHRAPRTVSLGRADNRYFTFNAGLGLDAEVVRSVEDVRATGRPISNALHARHTVRTVLRSDRRRPRLRVTVPGAEPAAAHLLFVSNVDPWTYWGSRPVRTNPGTSEHAGLGVFALRSMRLPTVLRVAAGLLRDSSTAADGAGPTSRYLLRRDDVDTVSARALEPIGLQMDGDYLGLRTEVLFESVPNALRLLGPTASDGGRRTG